MRRGKIDWRDWKPLSLRRLKEIVADTAKDCPSGGWTAAEIYRIAAELLAIRTTKTTHTTSETSA